MDALNSASAQIGGLLSVIRDIAEKTNLLALNASIEARALATWERFAVVANEVKAMASQTSKATQDIDNYVQTIKRNANNVNEVVQAIIKVMKDINENISEINESTNVQKHNAGSIGENVMNTSSNSKEMGLFWKFLKYRDHLLEDIKHVSEEATTMSNSVESLNKSAMDATVQATNVEKNVKNLNKVGEKIDQYIRQYKTE